MSRFHLTTFGRLALTDEGGRDDPSLSTRPRKLALLAWLALRPAKRATRDRIIGVFWGDRDEERARNSLSDAVSHLRRVLGRDAIQTRANEIAIADDAPLTVDCIELTCAAARQDHVQVAALYQGPFLDGFYINDAPDFDDWRDRERARMARVFSTSAARQCEKLADSASWDECRPLAERWLDAEPAATEAASMLLRAIAAPATRTAYAEVVTTYHALVRRLEHDVGIAPDASVAAIAQDAAAHLAAMPAPEPVVVAEAAPPVPKPVHSARSFRAGTMGVVAAGLVLVVLGAAAMKRAQRLDPHRVIVAVFENRTGDSTLSPLGAVAADWISRGLTETHAVEVADPLLNTARGETTDPREIGQSVRAGTVIVGSIERQGDSIAIDARIVDANTGRVLRSTQPAVASITAPLSAVNLLRQRVAGAMATELDPVLAGLATRSAQPPTHDAYLAWIEGIDLFSRTDYRASIPVFLRAGSLDSSFVTPRIWAMAAYGNMGNYRMVDSIGQTLMPLHSQMTRYDRGLFDMWIGVLRGDNQAQYAAAHDMLAAAPGSELAIFLVGVSALYAGRANEAIEQLRRIPVESSPLLWDNFGTHLGTAYHVAGRHDQEVRETARRLARQPNAINPMEEHARALVAAGRMHEASELVDRIVQSGRAPGRLPVGAVFNVANEMLIHGHPSEARQLFRRVLALATTSSEEELRLGGARMVVPNAFYHNGDFAAADSIAHAKLAETPNDISYLKLHGAVAAHRGDVAEAEAMSAKLAALPQPYMRGANTLARAQIAAILGRKDDAVTLLKQAIGEGQRFNSLHALPDLLALRGYAPFDRFMAGGK